MPETIHVTHNEMAVLRSVLNNFYLDSTEGEAVINNGVWSNCINDSDTPSGIEGKALSGVVSSLVKKGLLGTNGESVYLTRPGYEAVTR